MKEISDYDYIYSVIECNYDYVTFGNYDYTLPAINMTVYTVRHCTQAKTKSSLEHR